ncbi:MAG TPA: hypothetical protein VH482_04505 [Thermomicrobiales bacterium]|jgi:uncharacterized membrane protein
MTYGPLQLIVIGFGRAEIPLDFVNQLRRLRDAGIVRLVDAVFVSKDEHDDLNTIKVSDLSADEAVLLGTIAGALVGYGALGEEGIDRGAEIGMLSGEDGLFGLSRDDVDEIADRIPRGTAATFILLEHLWAIGLKEAVRNADGAVIGQGWITPETLVAMGKQMAEEAEANSTGLP